VLWSRSALARVLIPYLVALAAIAAALTFYSERTLDQLELEIRLEEPSPQVRQQIRAAIWGGVVLAALAAVWPIVLVSRRLSQRMARVTELSNALVEQRKPPDSSASEGDVVDRLEANLIAIAESLTTQLREARAEKQKLEAVLRGMVEAVLLIDDSGIVQLANQGARRLFGVPDTEALVGRPLLAVSRDPDLQELVRQVMEQRSIEPIAREVTVDVGGRNETLQVTAAPIAPFGAAAPLSVLVFHDVTDLKKLEATRRDFVANVSHELRTPLTAILGYAETLQSGAIDDPVLARKFLRTIERHSERLTRLTDDLLTLSDLELGRAALQRAPMHLAAAIDAAVDVVRDKAQQQQVEIRRDVPSGVSLRADADRIEQVFVNLIDNAVKYSPEGATVTIRAAVVDDTRRLPVSRQLGGPPPGSWVEIVVEDTGVGIPSQDLPRLTERFYRVDKARSRELGGTGLGLAIVKHIVQGHGGVLHIDSELGRGTRVYVYLPAASGQGPE
jgi:two-component system phosphate regulon sensor histidine kinase PhoR